jgi:hypothetical protein
MSFYLPFTKTADSTEMFTAPGANIYAESQALVVTQGATSNGVMPSTGTASDIFVGFAFAGTSALPFPEAYYNKVEQFTVGTTGMITLSLTPIAGQVFVYDNTLSEAITDFTLTGMNVTGLTAGDEVTVTYKYALSVIESVALFGNIQPGGYVGAYVGQIGVITRGVVWISEFDASQNWASPAAGEVPVLAANGQITLGTPGAAGVAPIAVPNCYVSGVPSMEYPFLGLTFSAA